MPTPDEITGVEKLSNRERQVLGMAAAGLLDKQIGEELGVSANTLRTYWSRIRGKLGSLPRSALVALLVSSEPRVEGLETPGPGTYEGWVLDVSTMNLLASDSINDLHGLSRGVAHPADDYARLYHPEDRDAARAELYRVIQGEVPSAHIIFRMVTANGVEAVSLTAQGVRNREGKTVKVIGIRTRTVDCRKGHNPKTLVGRWTRDFPGDEFWIDDTLRLFLGIRPDVENLVAEVQRRIHPDDLPTIMAALPTAIENGEWLLQHHGRFLLPDGSYRWVRASGHIEDLGEGRYRVHGFLTVFE